MKKIYLNNQEVKIGDLIPLGGCIVPLTEELIILNEDKFTIEKLKDLQYYENLLLECSVESFKPFYGTMKACEAKLYWLKVYELIAKDLNGDWKADYGINKWFNQRLNTGIYKANLHSACMHNLIYFKTFELVTKAADIMGKHLGWVC